MQPPDSAAEMDGYADEAIRNLKGSEEYFECQACGAEYGGPSEKCEKCGSFAVVKTVRMKEKINHE